MSETSAATGNTSTVSLEAMTKAMQAIDLLPKPDEWIVIDPNGRVFKGSLLEVTGMLLAEHPLLKMPIGTPMCGAAEQEQQT